MIDCKFCHSTLKDSYLYTQCSHLICVDCASAKWDQKYSIRCCNKTTYLDDDTCDTLLARSADSSLICQQQSKQNLNPAFQTVKAGHKHTTSSIYEEQRVYIRPKELQQTGAGRDCQSPMINVVAQTDRKRQQNLSEMQRILCEEVAKVKYSFDMCRKDLQRREQLILKELYNKYSDHMSNLKASCSDEDVKELKEQLGKVGNYEVVPLEREEIKSDKILQKLDYNQQMMREKLTRHYMLLK